MPIRVRSRLLTGSREDAADLRRGGGHARTAGLAAAALVPVLALTAACGGGGGDKAKKDPGPVRASGAVSTAKLTSALLTSKDVSHVQVLPAGSKTQLLGPATTVDKADCQPVADQWSSQPKHPRQVYTGAMVTDTADKDKKAKEISLSVIASYTPGTAKTVLDELTTALKTCHAFKATRNGAVTSYTVQQVPPPAGRAPLGDQEVSYTIANSAQGAAGVVLVTVVRSGDATAAYETVRADHTAATLREAIPLKQAEKLKAAATGN
ncbi:sensor domain-containing protein [Actinacidiphila alni]|uniref:sensor domain-containing protein n=1 Tax=Actinacidiphila alni TaxID=380248 RepID=UPI0033D62CDC